MECPNCKKQMNLEVEESWEKSCPHCAFYFYLRGTLRIACIAYWEVDSNEDVYFKNIHQRIYNPFIHDRDGKTDQIDGAVSMREYLISQFKLCIKGYPKDDLLFMMLGLRELATWKIILEPNDYWAATRVRNISHVFSNLIESLEQEMFSEDGIVDETNFISAFVISEEIDKIESNILNTRIFGWESSLPDMLKLRLENNYLAWYHQYFEVEELQKPEEIKFENPAIIKFLEQRKIHIDTVKKTVNDELEKLFGFSFQDLHQFRESIISIAEKEKQLFDIFPLTKDKFMRVTFIFKEQLNGLFNQEKLSNIIKYLSYKPSYKESDVDNPSNSHMDYKFLFEYENMLAIGTADSLNSMTMFENIASSDHFIQDIFGQSATKVFKKAQENIAYLIGMKIAEHFAIKEEYFVPTQQKNVPLVNFKTVIGKGIKKKIVSKSNMDLGDIDAVCVDTKNKIIVLMEIKYYKPAISNLDMLKKDKKILEDIPKIKARAEWFKANVTDVINAWGLEPGSYKVSTYLVTGRPNFYGEQIEKENENIFYFTYDKILRS
ncbi:hypothetical protein [Priestia sp. YIM B13489]|uniref:hypothetical protein n=1 Tax=Priestia sp. YIM B13489 TaxID=3366313 RepID=UPI003671BDBA